MLEPPSKLVMDGHEIAIPLSPKFPEHIQNPDTTRLEGYTFWLLRHCENLLLKQWKLRTKAFELKTLPLVTHRLRIPSSEMWRRVGLARTDDSEECVASNFKVERTSELGMTSLVC
jgi:hypothetical protein